MVFKLQSIAAIFSLVSLPIAALQATECHKEHVSKCADIVFMIETSERLNNRYNYTNLFNMMLTLTSKLNITAECNHAAFVHYSSADSRTGVLFNLMDHNSQTEMQLLVDTLNGSYEIAGIADLDLGLKTATQRVFVPPQDRSTAVNYAILISEGWWDKAVNCCPDPFKTGSVAELQSVTDTIFAIGVDCDLSWNPDCHIPDIPDVNVLTQITGSSANVYDKTNYTKIADRICATLSSC